MAPASLKPKIVFRLRSVWARVIDRFRTFYWRSIGLDVGQGTLLPQIYVTWPHQVSLGARCHIERGVSFKFDGIWRSGPSLVFGDNVFIGAGCEFNIRDSIIVGKNVLIASGCKFIDHDHGFDSRTVPIVSQTGGAEIKIIVEDDTWVGANVLVLKGVRIRRGAIIAAGSVLTKSVGAFEIWGGVPGRKLRDRPQGTTDKPVAGAIIFD